VIIGQLALAPATLSFHLRGLLRAGLVALQRDGRHLVYRADFARMDALLAYLTDQCCGGESCLASRAATATTSPTRPAPTLSPRLVRQR
jgi:DNA-binding transcriptional ArsR family regulator